MKLKKATRSGRLLMNMFYPYLNIPVKIPGFA